jgi:hypothetical protein
VVSPEEGNSLLPKLSVFFEYFNYNGKVSVSVDITKKCSFLSNVFCRITVLPEGYRLYLPVGSFIVL